MNIELIIETVVLIALIIQISLLIIFLSKNKQGGSEHLLQKLNDYEKRLDKNESSIRDEFGRNRRETNQASKETREELSASLKSFEEKFFYNISNFTTIIDNKIKSIIDITAGSSKSNRDELNKSISLFEQNVSKNISDFSGILNKELKAVQDSVNSSTRLSREELALSLKSFEEKFSTKIDALTKDTNVIFEKNRESIDKKLGEIQEDNSKKLEEMRKTVDEKLHDTLEKRLTESFKLVSENLDKVQKGLVEMQGLAVGVGDLKNILSNVKTKGVFGEYQLGCILEEMLAPGQYAQNVKTKEGSNDMVEYAVKIPSKEHTDKIIWLPIDAKFPTEDYERLTAAYDSGKPEQIEKCKKDLERTIKQFAKDINGKYIDPPHTTDFAIMFLPFESLYAETLRIAGLFDTMQREFKVTITGPTTISAFLNSLQMGFRSLAVEKRTSEIWELLGAVKTQFGKFGDVLEATKKKIDAASDELAKTGIRTRAIERRLQNVQTLPDQAAQKLLGNLEIINDDDE
ncbi:MAG: DNA recombination protein RmuC [Spirochaetaceae bacterium]|jgi:DNA recombination protein RmuC|nr:DNA recombination protein RmuC [Spirochaetaceae bacterium]